MPGKPPKYCLREIVHWLRSTGPWKPRGGQALPDDLLLADVDSPALERLRAAKAALAELELQREQRILITVEQSKEIGLRWATLIKRLGERLGKRYGRDATAAVHDTLEECRRVLEAGYAAPADADPDSELVDSVSQTKDSPPDKPMGRKRSRGPKRAPRR
jgi:hypothetical protein